MDVLQALSALKWRGDEYPCSRFKTALAHDLVEHRYWGVDGARVEATGMAPMRINATIPFHNGIDAGPREHWDPRLYPAGLRKLIKGFSNRARGILQHPELGVIVCKPDRLDIDWDAQKRSGCDVEVSWVETAGFRAENHEWAASGAENVEFEAQTLDANHEDIKPLLKQKLESMGLAPPVYKESFESMMNKVTGAVETVSLAPARLAGRLDAIVYRLDRLSTAVNRAKTSLTWPVANSIEKLKAAANNARRAGETLATAGGALSRPKRLKAYLVRQPMTLARLMVELKDVRLADLMRLNPGIMSSPTLTAGTVVRYYVR